MLALSEELSGHVRQTRQSDQTEHLVSEENDVQEEEVGGEDGLDESVGRRLGLGDVHRLGNGNRGRSTLRSGLNLAHVDFLALGVLSLSCLKCSGGGDGIGLSVGLDVEVIGWGSESDGAEDHHDEEHGTENSEGFRETEVVDEGEIHLGPDNATSSETANSESYVKVSLNSKLSLYIYLRQFHGSQGTTFAKRRLGKCS